MLEMVIFKDHLTEALLPAYPEISPFSAVGSKLISFQETQKKSVVFLSLSILN